MRGVWARVHQAYLVGGLSFLALALAVAVAWATHLVWVISKLASDEGATAGQVVLGLLGIFMPPIGIIHGVMIWFGIGF